MYLFSFSYCNRFQLFNQYNLNGIVTVVISLLIKKNQELKIKKMEYIDNISNLFRENFITTLLILSKLGRTLIFGLVELFF